MKVFLQPLPRPESTNCLKVFYSIKFENVILHFDWLATLMMSPMMSMSDFIHLKWQI